MNFYFQKSKSPALRGHYSSIYNIPETLLQSAIPCEIVIEIKKLFYNKIFYVESYSNQFEPIMHLAAMIFAIENRLEMEFHLRYDPIFDVKFEEENIVLTHGRRNRIMPIDNFLVQLKACLDDVITLADTTVEGFSDLYLIELLKNIPQSIDSRYVYEFTN